MANVVSILVTADDRASSKAHGIKGAFEGMAKAVGFATIAAGAATGAFAFKAINAASDLSESINAVNQIFGENAKTVTEWGKNNATSFGLSQAAFNEMATPMGAILQNLGLEQAAAADETINLTKRASDMASVFNTDVQDALQAINAGLRGEADPLERFGVSLKAAEVQARALADTGKETAKELTNQELTLARLALVYEQTNAVAGDFAATSDGLANGTRILKASFEDLSANMGTVLLPMAQRVVQSLVVHMEQLTLWFETNRAEIEATVARIASAMGTLLMSFRSGLEGIQPVFHFIVNNKPVLIAALVAIGAAAMLVFGPVGQIAVAIGAAITAFGFLRDNWRTIGNGIIGIVEDLVNGIIDGLNKAGNKIGDFVHMVLTPFAEAWNNTMGRMPGVGEMEAPHFMQGGIGEVTLGRIGGSGNIGNLGSPFQALFEGVTDVFKQGRTEMQGVAGAMDDVGAAATGLSGGGGGGGGGSLGAAADALDDMGLAAEEMFRTLNNIQDDFMHEQIEAYLQGGDAQVAVVKAQQDAMLQSARTIALDLVQTFGIDLPTALEKAMAHIRSSAEQTAQATAKLAGSARDAVISAADGRGSNRAYAQFLGQMANAVPNFDAQLALDILKNVERNPTTNNISTAMGYFDRITVQIGDKTFEDAVVSAVNSASRGGR